MLTSITPYFSRRGLSSDFSSQLWNEMNRALNGFSDTEAFDEREFSPPTEIAETDTHYLLSIDLPGLKKEDVKIEVADNVLSISGERKRESKIDEDKYKKVEKFYGSFKHSFVLPNTVDAEKIEAKQESGVLEIQLPKVPKLMPRKIDIA